MIAQADLARLVTAWHSSPDATRAPRVRRMLDAEIQRVHAAFRKLPVRVHFVDHDPYGSFEEMRDQVQTTGQMLIWKGGSETPLWDERTNWMARAVHDYDHIVHSCDFSMEGETELVRQAAQCTPGLTPIYLSEVMLQAAIKNYSGEFVPQKLVLLPEHETRRALELRGASELDAVDPDVVWKAAELLLVEPTPELVLVHLRAMGLTFEQAVVVLDAAIMVNATSPEDAEPDSYELRGAYAEERERFIFAGDTGAIGDAPRATRTRKTQDNNDVRVELARVRLHACRSLRDGCR